MPAKSAAPCARVNDEETPLLVRPKSKVEDTFPWKQFSIVLFLQLAEPLTSNVIYPFAPQLIRDVGVTHGDETKVGYYVGLMQSIFFATQALTVMHWSRVSDRIGRKPVILTGLFGLGASMYMFGLARTFPALVSARALNGALNGNIGVIKSMMAELVAPADLARAYAFMPIAWSTGSTLGPVIGGVLARPADRFPDWFGASDFHRMHPYFLACAIPATFTVVAWLVTLFFLEETVQNPILLFRPLRRTRTTPIDDPTDELPKPALTPSSSRAPSIGPASKASSSATARLDPDAPVPFRGLLTRPVLVSAANYAALSLVDIAYRAVQPVFYSTPLRLGGLGLEPSSIGLVLSLFGILNGLFQVLCFARIHARFGARRVYLAGLAAAIPAFALFPLSHRLARAHGSAAHPAVAAALGVQVLASVLLSLSYGCVFIFIAGAAPNRASLGATNGLCQTLVSVMRAIGPAAANSLFALSIDPARRALGGQLVYVVLEALAVGAVVVGTLLPRENWARRA